jgi:hypothetical protein
MRSLGLQPIRDVSIFPTDQQGLLTDAANRWAKVGHALGTNSIGQILLNLIIPGFGRFSANPDLRVSSAGRERAANKENRK